MRKFIKSITNVITNSSSEVFLMTNEEAEAIAKNYDNDDCIKIEKVTEEWLENEGAYEAEAIFERCQLKNHFTDEEREIIDSVGEYYYLSEEDWSKIYHNHKELIDEKMLGMSFIDIEDHFSNCEEAYDDARSCAVWSEYLH